MTAQCFVSELAITVLCVNFGSLLSCRLQLAPFRNKDADKGFPDVRWHQTYEYGYTPNPRLVNIFTAIAMDLPDFKSPIGAWVKEVVEVTDESHETMLNNFKATWNNTIPINENKSQLWCLVNKILQDNKQRLLSGNQEPICITNWRTQFTNVSVNKVLIMPCALYWAYKCVWTFK